MGVPGVCVYVCGGVLGPLTPMRHEAALRGMRGAGEVIVSWGMGGSRVWV